MIVKVQMPSEDNGDASALITSQDGKIHMHEPVSHVLAAKMNGASVRYFQADLDTPGSKAQGAMIRKNSALVLDLGEEVRGQSW